MSNALLVRLGCLERDNLLEQELRGAGPYC